MNKINIIGLGPGSRDLILPLSMKVIIKSTIIIGAKRNIESIRPYIDNKEVIYLNSNYKQVISRLRSRENDEIISIVVSGDTGFYSLVTYIKKHIDEKELNVITGISSMQYMFSKLIKTYENASLVSMHARKCNIVDEVKNNELVGVLTDGVNTPQIIANKLIDSGLGQEYTMYIGENLSYVNETISKLSLQEASKYNADNLNVVVIEKND